MNSFDTVTDALRELKRKGYTVDFNIAFDKIICSDNKTCLNPDEFEIVEVHRFEGDSNPADEDVVYVIESKDKKIKGTVTGAYGMYADTVSTEMIRKLSMTL